MALFVVVCSRSNVGSLNYNPSLSDGCSLVYALANLLFHIVQIQISPMLSRS